MCLFFKNVLFYMTVLKNMITVREVTSSILLNNEYFFLKMLAKVGITEEQVNQKYEQIGVLDQETARGV